MLPREPEPQNLLRAAKTALHLFGIIHDSLWALFPNELLALLEEDEDDLKNILANSIKPSR